MKPDELLKVIVEPVALTEEFVVSVLVFEKVKFEPDVVSAPLTVMLVEFAKLKVEPFAVNAPFAVKAEVLVKLNVELVTVDALFSVRLDDPLKLNIEPVAVRAPGATLPEVMFIVVFVRLIFPHMLNEVEALIVVLLMVAPLKENPDVILIVPPLNVQFAHWLLLFRVNVTPEEILNMQSLQ